MQNQRGITLIELVLWSVITAVAVVAVFEFASRARVAAKVETEQRQIETLIKAVDGMFMLEPNFSELGTDGASYLQSHGAQRAGVQLRSGPDGAALVTSLGDGRLNLAVWDVVRPSAPPIIDGGYRLAYQGLSAPECVRLTSSLSKNVHQASVGFNGLEDGSAVVVAHRYDRRYGGSDVIANMCGRPDRVVFLYFAPARAISPLATGSPATVLPRCQPIHETVYAPCPAGQSGAITQSRDGMCNGPDNTLVWTAWETVDSTCQNVPIAPPNETALSPPDNCALITTTRVSACPVGQTGQILEESTLDTCTGAQSPWTPLPPPLGNSCQSPVVSTCTPSVQREVLGCPAGQGGQIVRERASTCASTTASPNWPAWTALHVISNTCTAACSQGGTNCCAPIAQVRDRLCPAGTYGPGGKEARWQGCLNATTQASTWSAWVPHQEVTQPFTCTACPATVSETEQFWDPRSGPCPSGETGTITFEAEQVRTRDIAYACPTGTTSLPSPTTSTWSGWVDTGAIRNLVKTCTADPICTPPASTAAPITRALANESRNVGCGGTDPGERWQQRTVSESGTRTTSWACPGPVSTNTDTWSGAYTYGAWFEVSNTCSTCTPPASTSVAITRPLANQTQDVGCPVGYTGNHIQTRTVTENGTRTTSWSCPGPTSSTVDAWSGTFNYGVWTTTSNTCTETPVYNGQCSQITRPTSWGCGEFKLVSGSWVATPGSVVIDDSLNGGWFGNGTTGTLCRYGYIDVLDANGYPTPLTSSDRNKLIYDGVSPAPGSLEEFFQNGSDGSWIGYVGYGNLYARNAPPAPIRGTRCARTKFEFMNN